MGVHSSDDMVYAWSAASEFKFYGRQQAYRLDSRQIHTVLLRLSEIRITTAL